MTSACSSFSNSSTQAEKRLKNRERIMIESTPLHSGKDVLRMQYCDVQSFIKITLSRIE
eukprot:UN23321